MAKGNLFLGSGRGSVGDVTLSILNGKQLSRRRARVVANPQSSSQQLQRMVMSTVTGNAARLRSIISHSFQGVRAGADSYNYFNRVNLKLLRSQAVSGQIQGFRIKGAETFTPCEGMILGKGILQAPNIIVASDGITINNANVPETLQSEQNYLDFLSGTFGAQPGDEIAFLFVRSTTRVAAEYNGFYQPVSVLVMQRLVFMPWDDAFVGQAIVDAADKINSALLDYSIGGDGKPRTISNELVASRDASDKFKVTSTSAIGVQSAGAIFLSRPDGQGGWYNSNTSLVVGDVYYKQDEVVAADIQGSYGPAAAQEPVSDNYLEQSTTTDVTVADPAAVGFAIAESFSSWAGIENNPIEPEGLALSRNDVENGALIGLNFVPRMSRFSTAAGAVEDVVIGRFIHSTIPAGYCIMKFEATPAVTTAITGTLIFTAPDGTNVSIAVSVPAA